VASQQPNRDYLDSASAWPELARRAGGELRLYVAFVLCYVPALWLGYQLKTGAEQLSIFWPAVGLLMAVLFLAPLRRWPLVIALQLGAEYAMGFAMREPSFPADILLFMLANTLDAAVGALIARMHMWRLNVVRIGLALQFLAATAAGATASATLVAALAPLLFGAGDFWLQWQLWWVGNWLGSIIVAPVVLFWALPVRKMFRSLRLRNWWEIPVLGVALAASVWWLFPVPPADTDSLLRTPAVPLALLLVAAFRLPPRWASLLALGTLMLAGFLGAFGRSPFTGPDPYSQMLVLQAFLALLAAVALIFTILITAMKITMDQVTASETRYRNFVELSSEAVWRVELEPPMPLGLSIDEQRQWLARHARVAESNAIYRRFADACTESHGDHSPLWQPARSWCALFEDNLERAAREGYQLDDLRLTAEVAGRQRSFILTFSGVTADGHLQRIWCVARDISEIVDLNTRLLRERERLKAYAHQVVTAEERARRATAVDLHDGIGQSLTGMAMSLEVARAQAPQIAPLLDDLRANLRRVQEHTRTMIADLSPPGLYELGLEPALQWLAVHFRSKEKLRVQLECAIDEASIPMDLRVLIFKLVRELLRNVVKHAGVDAARVQVQGDRSNISVLVEDAGRGFEWQIDMFGARPGGFGLWSISDRVGEAGGQFNVDAQPGHGSRFRMSFPLQR
jgi:signal transduction histidine kinase